VVDIVPKGNTQTTESNVWASKVII